MEEHGPAKPGHEADDRVRLFSPCLHQNMLDSRDSLEPPASFNSHVPQSRGRLCESVEPSEPGLKSESRHQHRIPRFMRRKVESALLTDLPLLGVCIVFRPYKMRVPVDAPSKIGRQLNVFPLLSIILKCAGTHRCVVSECKGEEISAHPI